MRSDKLCKLFIFLTSILLFSLCVNPLHAQIRCATDESERKRHAEHPELETTEQFERWMQSKISKARLSTLTGRTEAQSYTIPVVVHILHNGEAVGVGANISVAQIQSQIAALNRDYPRHNPDSVNTPAEFKPVAGKIDITFVLAKQDPEGVPTNGITRDIGPKTSYNYDTDNSLIKSYSYWPAEEYLNIWVVPPITSGSKSLLGVAQFPQSSGLPGLEGGYTGRLTDGAIIYYRAFGDNSMGGNFNLSAGYSSGRTVVHEVGHYLGLRHIWGDPPVVSCDGTDYCADTPTQDSPTSGCPVHPAISCSHDKMFQNYMDYTSDVCYNLFTKNQVERMTTVLANSPSRISLLTSKGLFDPTLVANDAGIRKIVTPGPTTCGSTPITPVIQLRNYGSNAVTSVRAQISIGGVVQETKDFTVNLNYLDTVNVAFSAITLPNATANNVLQVTILQTNGGTDANAANNVVSETVATPSLVAVPFVEQFNSTPPTWMIINPDAGKTWQNTTAPYTTSSNKAMYINFYDYDAEFQQDYLLSPVFDLSTAATAILKFDRAYAQFSAAHPDGLRIFVSTDCDINGAFEIFNKAGADLATATTTTTAFAPKSASDWKTETISLTPYLGNAHVQLIFMGVNRNGNNLYLDNVSVTTDSFTDLAIVSLKSPSPVTCDDSPLPTINVANNGSTPITAFTITTIINGGAAINETVSNIDLETGQDIDVILHNWTLKSVTTLSRSRSRPLAPISHLPIIYSHLMRLLTLPRR